jgi:D-alanyl-D-alanine carboxypeptidase
MSEAPMHSAVIAGDDVGRGRGDPSAIFPWWSFTKTVIAAAALRLAEDGRLSLDETLPGRGFTLGQLLQHTAGVPNYGGLPEYHRAVAAGDEPWSREDLLRRVGAWRAEFPPGTHWAYSNVGYLFARERIEACTGVALGDALGELVLAPWGCARRASRSRSRISGPSAGSRCAATIRGGSTTAASSAPRATPAACSTP